MKQHLTAPPDAIGALYFLPGQYLFKRIEAEKETVKALSSEQIARAFREYRNDTGWIARRVLRYREEPERNYILSFEPAGRRMIPVETDDGRTVEIRVPLPALILYGRGREFYLWATREKKITSKTRLWVAPLPNIGAGSSGSICFGSNEVPNASIAALDMIWNLIWSAPFNGDHAESKCRSEPKDVRRLLFDLAGKNARRFPNTELLPANATIEDLWAAGRTK